MACYEGMYKDDLTSDATSLARSKRGILAVDETNDTLSKRFQDIGIENTESNRRAFRELLFTAPEALYSLKGVLLSEEALYQSTADGKPFVKIFEESDILPGIKVDMGQVWICNTHGETTTEGLCGLANRCQKYYEAGARFAKWRACFKVGDREPTELALRLNIDRLGSFAIIAQENGLVPVIQPEIMLHGSYDISDMANLIEWVLANLYKALRDHGVLLEGTVLRLNMVQHGSEAEKKDIPETVADHTMKALQRTVPPAVPSIVFLSGGGSEEDVTKQLDAICRHTEKNPWSFTFAFGRALTQSVLKVWGGKEENKEKAQEMFKTRCKANFDAAYGKYVGYNASEGSPEKLYSKFLEMDFEA